MKWKIGDIANGQESSEQFIEDHDYVEVLEMILENCGLYCRPIDIEAKENKVKIDTFRANGGKNEMSKM